MPDTTQAQGSYGQHIGHADFYGTAAPFTTSGLNTEVISYVVDEPDGVISLVTGGADDDTAVVSVQGVFTPAKNGPLALEARLKSPVITNNAWFSGFTAKDANTSQVADANAVTGTVNDAAGLTFDSAQNAANVYDLVVTGNAITQQNATNDTVVADKYTIVRTEIDPDGSVRNYTGTPYGKDGYGVGSLRLVSTYGPGAISKTALLFPQVYGAGRTSATTAVEVDYVHFTAGRCWTA